MERNFVVTTFFLIDHTWLLHTFQTEAELDHFLTLNCIFTYGWTLGTPFPSIQNMQAEQRPS